MSANIQSTSVTRSLPCLLSDQCERATVAKLTLQPLVIDAFQGDVPIRTTSECFGDLNAEGQPLR